MKNLTAKRILSALLCLAMLVGILPASVLAEGIAAAIEDANTIYVLAGGDFQEAGDHTASAENVTNILATIKGKYPTMDGFLFIGDYDCETHEDYTQTDSGIAKLMETVQASYSNINHANSILAQGNHDDEHEYIDGSTTGTYGYDLDGYAAFVLNEDQYPNGGGTKSGIEELANTLDSWLQDKIADSYTAPIFIVSHLPLAFTTRTNTQGDGMYAKYIFDVLNNAAAEGLNIFFLHGHNHAYGYDEYLGGHAIYLAKGDKINIAELGSKSSYTEETLNFTYMNAGYTGYYNESGYTTSNTGTDKLSMTVFAIKDDSVTIGRYSADGAIDLKAAGEAKGDYINQTDLATKLNTDVYYTTQTVGLVPDTTQNDADTGVSVTAPGVSGVTVTKKDDTNPDDTKYGAYVTYDITVTGYINGTTAVVTIPLSAADGFDLSRSVMVMDPKTGTTISRNIEGGAVTFTTNHFSEFIVAQSSETAVSNGWVQISSASGATGYEYVLDTDGVIDRGSDNRYIIVARDAAKALYTDGSAAAAAVDVAINGNTVTTTTRDYEYYFTSGNLITKDGTNYLEQDNWYIYHSQRDKSSISTFEHLGNGYYSLADTDGTARGMYYYASNNQWTVTGDHGEGTYNNSDYAVRLYKYVGEVAGTDEYARMEADASIVTDFNPGSSQEDVEDVIKNHIRVYSSVTGSDEDQSLISDSEVTWTWDGGFNAAGYSTLVVSYKGKELGSVTVHVAVTPGTGSLAGWVEVKTPVTGDGYHYVLDTDGIDVGEEHKYLIVGANNNYAMQYYNDDISHRDVTISGNVVTITSDPSRSEFYFASNSAESGTYLITQDGSNSVQHGSGDLSYGTTNRGYWYFGSDDRANGLYQLYDFDNQNWYLNYGYIWANQTTNVFTVTDGGHPQYVRLYKYVGQGEIAGEYASLKGPVSHTIAAGTMTQQQIEEMVKADITAVSSPNEDGSGTTTDITNDLVFSGIEAIAPSKEGNYTVTVTYQGKTLGTINVCVQARKVASVTYPTEGYIDQYASGSDYVTDKDGKTLMIEVLYEGETAPVQVPMTLNMLRQASDSINTNKAGLQEDIFIHYGSSISAGDFVLHVEAIAVNDYPEYPDEGAVKVSKTATGIDFQSTGIAQIELSVSGVPVKKGADVIVMLDTSSSMDDFVDENGDGQRTSDEPRRIDVLNQSMQNLVAQLQSTGDDGQPLDIRLAIGDFNGFYGAGSDKSGTPYDRDANDKTVDASYDATSQARVMTGTGRLDASAFVQAKNYTWTDIIFNANDTGNDQLHSGTNYDYAMDAIYQLGASIKQRNLENGEERDLYVIFLSDGAAMQWNYYHSQGASETWEHWITGDQPLSYWNSSNLSCTDHLYYFDDWDHDGDGYVNEHRMANAIKGDPNMRFDVIRKSTEGLEDLSVVNIHKGRNDNMYMVNGLGAKMWSISFDATTDTNVEAEHMIRSIASLATPQTTQTQYAYNVASAQALGRAFTAIGTEIAYAAENARFEDKMGESFNVQMTPPKDAEGNIIESITPAIEVLTYDIWTLAEYEAKIITDINQVGTRKGTYRVEEVVLFEVEEGTGTLRAYSSAVDGPDADTTPGVTVTENADGTYSYAITDRDDFIISATEGTDDAGFEYEPNVIYARSFIYNANPYDVNVYIHGTVITVAAESFYWNIGTVTTTEQALRYYVYLDGSMEGTKEAGSYATNAYATIYYTNYLGNDCRLDTVSPSVAWESANVSYAFYLVDQSGNIIVNQSDGTPGSFANKIAVTNPVLFDEVLLNNEDVVRAINIASLGVLPEGYELYDKAAAYEVHIGSGSNYSRWEISSTADKQQSTFVTQYSTVNPSSFTNKTKVSTDPKDADFVANTDLTHTIVWFAVVWTPQALPDSVIIDYGLPVDVSVLVNDMFGENGKLVGVAPYIKDHDTAISTLTGRAKLDGFDLTAVGNYGVATADPITGKIRYQLSSMEIDGYDKFTYMVEYSGKSTMLPYYYDTMTIIPATTVYYEDNFLSYSYDVWDETANDWVEYTGDNFQWVQVANDEKLQDEDRPGKFSLSDANNVYGYDGNYRGMSQYSLNGYSMATVDYDHSAVAEFVFSGTGFDIISMVNTTTGAILVDVIDEAGAAVRQLVVDTYYGYKTAPYQLTYTYTEGAWKLTEEVEVETLGEEVEAPASANEGDTYVTYETRWVVDADASGSLWQVPVMKVADLDHGTYTVKIRAQWDPIFEHRDGHNSYDFYLDAIRIYDPADDGAGEDTTIRDAYVKDGEGWPLYFELRDQIIDDSSFGTDATAGVNGIVYIDGQNGAELDKYTSFGPNNELYLTNNNAVAFRLDLTAFERVVTDEDGNIKYEEDGETPKTESIVADVQIGVKSADGAPVIIKAWNLLTEGGTVVKANEGTAAINTATDMYYSLKRQVPYNNALIVLQNIGSGIMSITSVKITFKEDPYGASNNAEAVPMMASFSITPEEAGWAVMSLSLDWEDIPGEPEIFTPEKLDVSVNRDKVKEGDKVKVTVKTSGDVEYITVNGEAVTSYRTNRKTGERTWTVHVSADAVGELPIEVIAYNADEIASEAVTKTVQVEAKSNVQKVVEKVLKSLFDRLFG